MALLYKYRIAQEIIGNLSRKPKLDLNHVIPNMKLHFNEATNDVSFSYYFKSNKPLAENDVSFGKQFIQTVKFDENKIGFAVDIDEYMRCCLTDNLDFNTSRSLKKPLKTVVDFSSPNIAKPFHFGHLRSTMIGNYISNISAQMGDDVVKINYLGDWGTQFGLLSYGLDECKINVENLGENPLRVLYNAYVSANSIAEKHPQISERAKEIFRKMEFAEEESDDLKKWSSIRTQTVNEISKVYKRLNIQFDEYSWESDYSAKRIENLIKTLIDANIIVKENDLWVAKIDAENSVPVVKSDGTTLYLTRDLAAVLDRYKRHRFDKMLYVVDNSQSKHFKNFSRLVEKLDTECAQKIQHVIFGRVIGLSTRKGTAVFLDDILDEIREKMRQRRGNIITTRGGSNDRIDDILGISAVVINDLKRRRCSNYEFNWDSIFQSKGNSGIKLQYCHCRLYSLEKSCGVDLPRECDPSVLKESVAIKLIILISRFEEIITKSYEELEASILIKYLFELCDSINIAHKNLKVKGESDHVAAQRLLMFNKARLVLNIGMKIIGIEPLDEM